MDLRSAWSDKDRSERRDRTLHQSACEWVNRRLITREPWKHERLPAALTGVLSRRQTCILESSRCRSTKLWLGRESLALCLRPGQAPYTGSATLAC